jgi:hypothetical protein
MVEPVIAAERPQERLLKDVLRVLAVLQQTPEVGMDFGAVPLDQRLKGWLCGYRRLPADLGLRESRLAPAQNVKSSVGSGGAPAPGELLEHHPRSSRPEG